MRIGFDAKRAFLNKTGLGNYSRTLLLQIFQSFPENQYVLFTPELDSEFAAEIQNFNNVKTISGENKAMASLWRSVFLSKTLQQKKLDIYHGLSQELPFRIHHFSGAKVVTVHDLIFLRYPEGYAWIDRVIYNFKAKYACKHADLIIAISEQTKADIVHFYDIDPGKIHVVYQDCSSEFKEPISPETLINTKTKYNLPDRYILTVGALNKRKNNDTLLRAAAGINEIPVVIVGSGNQKNHLENLASELGIAHRILFLGHLPDEDLPAVYKMAEVFVYPSLFEGFGIPILEALNLGVPVITGKNGVFREVAGSHALYFNQNDYKDLETQLKKMLAQNNVTRNLSEDLQNHLLQFQAEATVPKVMEVYTNSLRINGTHVSQQTFKKGISALLITYNEEDNIQEYIENFSFADEIILVDSYSTDSTVEIAAKHPKVRIFHKKFENFSAQKNFAIDQAQYKWCIFFDADERINDRLKFEIISITKTDSDFNCFYIYRDFYFMNKKISYSGWQNDRAIRLFRNGTVRYREDKLVHEQMNCHQKVGRLQHRLQHFSFRNVEEYENKLDLYARLRAKELFENHAEPSKFKRTVKPLYRFAKHYFIQFGFLDGKEGLIIAKLYQEYVSKRFKYYDMLKTGSLEIKPNKVHHP
ncbi:MAG: glycosyltransferase [Weeksellaceae bacterium]|nr:glycosyltransferase [Weeksellaceae bacterium]